jgi:type I restriction enzyme S subunit
VELGALGLRIHGGGTPSTKNPAYWGGAIPWTTSAYIDDRLYLDRCAGFTTPEGLSNSSSQLVPKGNVLVGTRVGVGKVAINAIDTAISQDLTAIIVDSEQTCSEFLAYSIKSDAIQEEILSASRGTTIKGIPRADLIRIPISLPPLPEQRRIATVLNAIQEAIAAQEDVIAAARHFKRSLMQRLFTYGPGREPAPTKETEIGEIPAHWEVTQIGELANFVGSGITPRGGTQVYTSVGVPFIRSQNVLMNRLSMEDIAYIPRKMHRDMARTHIFPGDVLLNITGASIGRVAAVPSFLTEANVNQHVCCIRFQQDAMTSYFAAYYLATPRAQAEIMGTQFGTTRQGLNYGQVRMLRLPAPPLAEQQEISDMLAAIDAKIAAEEDRKTALEALFKSMLHQLMTGKVRLLTDEGLIPL